MAAESENPSPTQSLLQFALRLQPKPASMSIVLGFQGPLVLRVRMRLFRNSHSGQKQGSFPFGKEPKNLLSAQREDHVYSGLHLNGLVVKQVRTIAPGSHRIQGRLLQHR